MIRKDILDKEKWVFKGDFNKYELPKSLKSYTSVDNYWT